MKTLSQEKKNLSIINVTSSEVKDISTFCKLNNIEDVEGFMKQCYSRGYNLEKYGLLDDKGQPKVIEKEVEKIVYKEIEKIVEVPSIEYVEIEKEVIKEVPVEKVVERVVEVIKEVPVDRVVVKEVIKEIPIEKVVEKEIYITDDEQVKELGGKVAKLEDEKQKFSTKIEEMENIFQQEVVRYDTQISDYIRKIDELENKPPTVIEKTTVDDTKLKALQETVQKQRQEIIDKNKLIDNLQKSLLEVQKHNENIGAVYLRGSNLDKKL